MPQPGPLVPPAVQAVQAGLPANAQSAGGLASAPPSDGADQTGVSLRD